MTGWRSRTGALACVTLLAVASPAGAADDTVDHQTLFRFADPAIAESSGLVDAGQVVYTVNDSGAGPVLYAVDAATGETTGVTTYSHDAVEDVEALAPGRAGTVWVADIGDNATSREQVSLYRVRPGRGDAPRYDLRYPDGPRDAEALLVHPRNGRVFVVSKTVFGGTVYEAAHLDAGTSIRLRPFAQVPGLVTDGAFFPDGRHVLLRSYGTASIYSFPDFDLLDTVTLPAQRQGEAVAIGADGRILLSSEGVHAPVLEVTLPATLAATVAGTPASATDAPGAPSETGSGVDPWWLLGGAAVLAVLAGLVVATRMGRTSSG